MTVTVRDFQPHDAEAWVRGRRAALPYMVATPGQVLYDLARARPGRRYRPLVAEEDGEVTGTAQVGLSHDSPVPGQGFCNVYTGNDAGNGPMLAVNTWSGHTVCATEVRHVRALV